MEFQANDLAICNAEMPGVVYFLGDRRTRAVDVNVRDVIVAILNEPKMVEPFQVHGGGGAIWSHVPCPHLCARTYTT